METETKTTTVSLRPCTMPTGKLSAVVQDDGGTRVVAILTMEELQGLIQAAYDEHGMLAEPSMVVEIHRVLSDDAQQIVGVDCGMSPCSNCAPQVSA